MQCRFSLAPSSQIKKIKGAHQLPHHSITNQNPCLVLAEYRTAVSQGKHRRSTPCQWLSLGVAMATQPGTCCMTAAVDLEMREGSEAFRIPFAKRAEKGCNRTGSNRYKRTLATSCYCCPPNIPSTLYCILLAFARFCARSISPARQGCVQYCTSTTTSTELHGNMNTVKLLLCLVWVRGDWTFMQTERIDQGR